MSRPWPRKPCGPRVVWRLPQALCRCRSKYPRRRLRKFPCKPCCSSSRPRMTIRLSSQSRFCTPAPACSCTRPWRRTYQRRQWGHLGSSPQCMCWRSRFGTHLNSRSAWYNPRIDWLPCHRSRLCLCSTNLPCRQRKGRWSSRQVRTFRRNRCRWRTSRIGWPDKVVSVLGSLGPCCRFRERPGRTPQQPHQEVEHPIPSHRPCLSLLLPSERRHRRLPRPQSQGRRCRSYRQ
jgi:hypothetical protein